MRIFIATAAVLAGLAGSTFALGAPLNVDVVILTGPGGSFTPTTHVPAGSTSSSTGDSPPTFGSLGSPLHHDSSTFAIATLLHQAAPSNTAAGAGAFLNSAGTLAVFNRSTLAALDGGDIGVAALPDSYRVQTTASGIFTRTAVASGANSLTLNIVNSALQLVDNELGAFAQIQTIVTVKTANGTQSYTLNASLSNIMSDPPDPMLIKSFDEEQLIVGNVSTSGPSFGGFNGGTLFVAPAYAVTFNLGNLAAGALIDIHYLSTTVAFSPFAPTPGQFVRAQFGDPDQQGGTNIGPVVSAEVVHASEPSTLLLFGIGAILVFCGARRRSAWLS